MTEPVTIIITVVVSALVPLYLRNNLLISEIRERIARLESKVNIIYDIIMRYNNNKGR